MKTTTNRLTDINLENINKLNKEEMLNLLGGTKDKGRDNQNFCGGILLQ